MRMDEFNLDELLKSASVPEHSEGYWQSFPRRVTDHLTKGTSADIVLPSRAPWFLGLGLAALCLVVGVICTRTWIKNRPVRPENLVRLYREVTTVFPNRVRAIVIDDDGVSLDLSEKGDVPNSPPLRVQVCQSRQCRTYITFSGQQIRVGADRFDVFSDGLGHVLVVGRTLVWTSEKPTLQTGDYHIDAEKLGSAS